MEPLLKELTSNDITNKLEESRLEIDRLKQSEQKLKEEKAFVEHSLTDLISENAALKRELNLLRSREEITESKTTPVGPSQPVNNGVSLNQSQSPTAPPRNNRKESKPRAISVGEESINRNIVIEPEVLESKPNQQENYRKQIDYGFSDAEDFDYDELFSLHQNNDTDIHDKDSKMVEKLLKSIMERQNKTKIDNAKELITFKALIPPIEVKHKAVIY